MLNLSILFNVLNHLIISYISYYIYHYHIISIIIILYLSLSYYIYYYILYILYYIYHYHIITGQLTIWEIPSTGLAFVPAYTVRLHNASINDIIKTNIHAITISDDSCIIFTNLFTFERIRCININEWCSHRNIMSRADICRRIKCIHLEPHDERIDGEGAIVVGRYMHVIISLSSTQ